MSKKWVEAVLGKVKVHQLHPDHSPGVARIALVSTYLLISRAQPGLLSTLETMSDAELEARAPAEIAAFDAGDFNYRLGSETSPELIIRDLFVRLRALDDFVGDHMIHRQPSLRPDVDWLVPSDDGQSAYLIPRFYQRRPSAQRDRRGDIGRFSHRGLIRHRIIPALVGTYQVKVTPARVWTGRGDGRAILGSALFPALALKRNRKKGSFSVDGVQCERHDELVDGHIDQALENDCTILVFPELTIDPDRLAQIRSRLRKAKTRPGRPRSIALVLAGSWHFVAANGRRNVSTLLDHRGRDVVTHDKLLPFNKNGDLEEIALGDRLNVIVTEDAIVGLAICRDYCDRGLQGGNPFDGLDVDLMLVPSMGGRSTMTGHKASAQELRYRWRGSAFVVQQRVEASKAPFGHVLFPDDDPQADVKAFEKHDTWNFRVMT